MSTKTTIALVEDDHIMSDVLCEGLEEAGYNVERAFDGEEGLALIRAKKPALVLLNILLPKVDGLTVAKLLRSDPGTRDIPIIILTVLDRAEPLAGALESGVFEYIVKSDFKVEDIVKKVGEKLTSIASR